jgi:hypothetical protein
MSNPISPELLQALNERAEPKNSWEGYSSILQYLQGAAQRVPTQEDLESIDIDHYFSIELHYIAALVHGIFTEEGFEELESYLYDPLPLL